MSGRLGRLGARWNHYCLRKLPFGDQRDIGAGYTMAAAALLAITVAVPSARLLDVLFGPHSIWAMGFVGVLGLPLVVPSAFVAGSITWRYLLSTFRCSGVGAGVVATGLTYVFATTIAAMVLMIEFFWTNPETMPTDLLFVFVYLWFVVGNIALGVMAWIAVPVGALSGAIYERGYSI